MADATSDQEGTYEVLAEIEPVVAVRVREAPDVDERVSGEARAMQPGVSFAKRRRATCAESAVARGTRLCKRHLKESHVLGHRSCRQLPVLWRRRGRRWRQRRIHRICRRSHNGGRGGWRLR